MSWGAPSAGLAMSKKPELDSCPVQPYVQRRCSSELGGLVSTTRCHAPGGLAHNFGLDSWIADGRGGQCDCAIKHQNRYSCEQRRYVAPFLDLQSL
jgi:hypothetical protein